MSDDSEKSTREKSTRGRKPGIPNRATTNAREAIARIVDGNAHRLQGWLDQIAVEQGPEKAFRCFQDLIEYHVPKLARHEHTGDGGGPVVIAAQPLDEKL